MDRRRCLPRAKPKPSYSPWVSLDYILDRLEEEGDITYSRDGLKEFLGWYVQDRLQFGQDADGNLIARMPLG